MVIYRCSLKKESATFRVSRRGRQKLLPRIDTDNHGYMKKIFISLLLLAGMCPAVLAIEPVSPPKRIVSLAPSMTEILFALGLGDNIVGVTSFCDYPEAAKAKSKVGGMSNPSLEAVLTLKPDLVVMTTDGNPKEFEQRLHALNIKTYVLRARRIAELPNGYREMGRVIGISKKAEHLARELERALERFGSWVMVQKQKRAREGQGTKTDQKNVLFIVWPDPLIVAGPGTAMDDAITMLGQQNIAADALSTYPKYSLEEVIRRAPEVLIVGKGSGMDMREVSKGVLQRLASVPAVKNNAVCYVSDNLYRLGPRVVSGIEELAACLK